MATEASRLGPTDEDDEDEAAEDACEQDPEDFDPNRVEGWAEEGDATD